MSAVLSSVGQQQALFKEGEECRGLIRDITTLHLLSSNEEETEVALVEAMAPPGAGTTV
jgi:hypothetical protein